MHLKPSVHVHFVQLKVKGAQSVFDQLFTFLFSDAPPSSTMFRRQRACQAEFGDVCSAIKPLSSTQSSSLGSPQTARPQIRTPSHNMVRG